MVADSQRWVISDMSKNGTEQMAMKEGHYAEEFHSRHFEDTVEVWCPEVDETKVVLGRKYTRHCPMCGGSIEVAP